MVAAPKPCGVPALCRRAEATLRSSDHRTFDVDAALCPHAQADEHCCGYFDASEGNRLQVQALPTSCRDLIFVGERYGFVYPRVDLVYAAIADEASKDGAPRDGCA